MSGRRPGFSTVRQYYADLIARFRLPRGTACALALLLAATGIFMPVQAEPADRSLCVYDPIGAHGFIYQLFQSYLIQAREWGVRFDLRPYTSEAVVADDFKSGRCDAAGMTGVQAREFVKFAGSLDMVGGLQTYDQLHTAIRVMSSPAAAEYMKQGPYEVAGVVPGGKVFLFSRDREWLAGLEAAAGKKVAVLSYDKQASTLARVAGVSPVPASIATFGPMFNNGAVDMAYAPAFAHEVLELYKGLGERGGIADFVLGMLSLQLVIHADRFPEGFAQKSRLWVLKQIWDPVMRRIRQSEKAIPDKYWVPISGQREAKYRPMIREVRQRLWVENWYSHKMQALLKKIRCQSNPSLAECRMDTEGGPLP